MKTILFGLLLALSSSAVVNTAQANTEFAKPLTAMGLVEKASYQIGGQTSQKKIDTSFLTDITLVRIQFSSQGSTVVLLSPSADSSNSNTFTLNFDPKGSLSSSSSVFHSRTMHSPIFRSATSATYLDKLAETFVDHFDQPENLEIAQKAVAIELLPNPSGVLAEVLLTDKRVYHVQMDASAHVMTRGF